MDTLNIAARFVDCCTIKHYYAKMLWTPTDPDNYTHSECSWCGRLLIFFKHMIIVFTASICLPRDIRAFQDTWCYLL